jgi:hypothetical protein
MTLARPAQLAPPPRNRLRAIGSVGAIRPPRGPQRAKWNGFVRRCLRSWVAAEASVRAFFDQWSPLEVFNPAPQRAARSLRRRAASGRPLAARRGPRCPAVPLRRAASPLVFDSVDPAALRQRFPYVAELLAELADLQPGEERRPAAGKRTRAAR